MTTFPAPGGPDDDEQDGQEPDETPDEPDGGPPDERDVADPDPDLDPESESEPDGDGDEAEDRTPPEVAALRREAAGYRRRLRETEAERDGLLARVETVHRAEVERVAGGVLADAGDLWRDGGVDLGGLLDEAGDVDAAAVTKAARAIVKRRPHWASPLLDPEDYGVRARVSVGEADPLGNAVRRAAGGQ